MTQLRGRAILDAPLSEVDGKRLQRLLLSGFRKRLPERSAPLRHAAQTA